ncbi:MAG: hypothetical protein HOQ11_11385 [Gemmatimonadaceae bacterium]|nr:hypothetical protein [Gemmatimonadaceae bacterium]NUQ93914.1 hypothetical protein [Gemmatimonadaceae bacterium]NUR21151.1 hypothetical protein [Gemmatimonadaceae bacterium]NUS97998.1 hypothetical protein [Gemmatimonadaceae bacterium]
MRSISRSLLAAATLLAACGGPAAKAPAAAVPSNVATVRTADELVRAMHDRYAGKWYHTATFTQRNTRYLPSGAADTSTWLEAMRVPGALRIDIEPLAQKNGILFVRDSQFIVGGGQLTRSIPSVHPLMVLGFDVYADPPERTLARIRSLGFDLAKIHEAAWQGRPAYVVGAAAGDEHSRQFWIDRERLVFVRMLQPDRDTSKTAEIQFNKYRKLGGGWIAPEVVFLTDGKPTFTERYEDIRVDPVLNDALFDPRAWNAVPHWHTTAR